jgi:hypothetical protein
VQGGTPAPAPDPAPAPGAARALRTLLQAYDLANRLAIDTVYAQFSPTLDDFYSESLRLIFPPHLGSPDEVRPEIVLTRTVPGQEPKSVRGAGAPFPLAQATRLAGAAIGRNPARVRPGQVGGGQAVSLFLEPEGVDLAGMLPPA